MTSSQRRERRDVVVIGASAGGVPLLKSFFAKLEPTFGATFFVTIHRPPVPSSELAWVLGRRSELAVREPEDGEAIEKDTVYLAPPDRHMRVDGLRVALDRGPKEHHTRPAVDPLFVSAASRGRRVIAILMSGNLSDGVAGMIAVKAAGGLTLAQDPSEAEWPQMPRNALLYDHVDLVFQVEILPRLLRELVAGAPIEDAAEASRGR